MELKLKLDATGEQGEDQPYRTSAASCGRSGTPVTLHEKAWRQALHLVEVGKEKLHSLQAECDLLEHRSELVH